MFLVELIASSFLDLISRQARQNAAVSVFLLCMEYNYAYDLHASHMYVCMYVLLLLLIAIVIIVK